MTDNGKVPAGTAERVRPSPDLLTPRDMLRARTALAAVLGDRSPYDMFEEDDDRVPFIIWCLKSRADPDFTWDDALDTPYLAEFEVGDSRPPQIAAPSGSPASATASASRKKQIASEPEPSSASSSG